MGIISFDNLKSFYIGGKEVKNLYINGRKSWEKPSMVFTGLCFTAEEDNVSVLMVKMGTAPEISLSYSLDGNSWNVWEDPTTDTITLQSKGDKVYFKATTTNSRFGSNTSSYNGFSVQNKFSLSGNIMSLLDGNNYERMLILPQEEYIFSCTFYNCVNLIDASMLDLHATTLYSRCYFRMFAGCSSLVNAPQLPATTLRDRCYWYMFQNCSSLVNAPQLPATTLYDNCYQAMFSGCSSLVNAPQLPATTLASLCYASMFQNCTSLTTAPQLPATTLASQCYSSIFSSCSKLNYIKIGYTGTFSTTYFNNWVSGVSSTGDFYYNGTSTTRGTSAIPTGWTIHTF